MATTVMLELLAQLPESAIYINPWKLATAAVLFTLWVLIAQWIDKDTVSVNTFQTIWNGASISVGTAALGLLLLLPNFWAAIGAFALVHLTFSIIYVVHRNGLVVEDDKVCTSAHFKRLMSEGFKGDKKKEKREVRERVRITGANHEVIPVPDEDEEREKYGLSQDLLFDALWRRAERVEILPAGQASKIRVRIDGIVNEKEPSPRQEGDAILLFFKEAAGLNLEERRRPQKGQILAAMGDDHRYDVFVHTDGSTAGEKLTLRIVGEEKHYKVDDLGFTDPQLETIREAMNADIGLILLTAPPEEGLTTTIYSLARSHDAFLQNIQTLEYERELEINNITQHVFTPGSEDKTFIGDLQRVIRTDPDVIVLPEVREKAAASLAATAASGKQVIYAAIKALDLFDGLKRWAQMTGDTKLLAQSTLLITHQRLVRKLCPSCKAPYKPDPATLKKLNMPADQVLYRPPEPQYDKHGNPLLCQHCHGTGYVGRTAVFNILQFDDELRKVIAGGGSMVDIKRTASQKGALGLQQHALQKVFDGVTSIEEVVRATRPPALGGPKKAKPTPSAAKGKPSTAN